MGFTDCLFNRSAPAGKLESFRPDQKGQATAQIYQLPQIHTAEKTASGSGRRSGRLRVPGDGHSREDESGSGRLRPSQESRCRRRSSAGSWKKIQTAARSDQEGQAGSGSCGRYSAGKLADGSGRRSGRSDRRRIHCERSNVEKVASGRGRLRKAQAVAGVPLPLRIPCGRSRRELEVFRPDQKGQATARIPQLSQIHAAGKMASGRGRRTIREISHAGNKCRIQERTCTI